jgi:hypothetical protein
MIVTSQLALKTHTNLGCTASLATLDKLVDRFPLPTGAPPNGDTSPTHVMKLAAQLRHHRLLAIMTLYIIGHLYSRQASF